MRVAGVIVAGALTALGLVGCTKAAQPGFDAAPSTPIRATATISASRSSAAAPMSSSARPVRTATPTVTRPTAIGTRASTAPVTTPTPVRSATRPTPAGSGLPLSFSTAGADQVITVTAARYGDTQATAQAWTRTTNGWLRRGPAIPAWLGYAGFSTQAREGYSGTPVGSFGLTHTFGNDANPGVRLPYFQADANDWWNGDSASAGYNTHQHCVAARCPFRTGLSENLHDAGWVYGYAAVIDYNTNPVRPGGGSAFFLHVTENHPTQGCVSIAQGPLVDLLRWLDPTQQPRILMGVG